MAEPVRQTADRLKKDWPRLAVENAAPWFARMRRVKRPEEIAAHRIACRTTVEAVRYMMAHTRPEMTEGQIEAYFDFIVKAGAAAMRLPQWPPREKTPVSCIILPTGTG